MNYSRNTLRYTNLLGVVTEVIIIMPDCGMEGLLRGP